MHAKVATMLTWESHVGSWNMHVGICNMHVETQHLFLMTPPSYGNPTPPSPGGRGSSRRGRGMGDQNGPQADADVQ